VRSGDFPGNIPCNYRRPASSCSRLWRLLTLKLNPRGAMSTQSQSFVLPSTRGVDPAEYLEIKRLVTLSFPRWSSWFFREFGERTIDQVLRQIDRKRTRLTKNSMSVEQKVEIEKSISMAEMLAWGAILEINSDSVGPWRMDAAFRPTEEGANGQPLYRNPSLRVTAVHSKSEERRSAVIPGMEPREFPKHAKAWRLAYEELGIWDLVYRGSVNKGVLSKRHPRGWTVFTKHIIPRLYDHLLPQYEETGHHSQKRDLEKAGKAQFSKELLEDMLSILRTEHPGFFDDASVNQLKAVVQRHLQNGAKVPAH